MCVYVCIHVDLSCLPESEIHGLNCYEPWSGLSFEKEKIFKVICLSVCGRFPDHVLQY